MHLTTDVPPLLVTLPEAYVYNGVKGGEIMAVIAIHKNTKVRMALNAGLDLQICNFSKISLCHLYFGLFFKSKKRYFLSIFLLVFYPQITTYCSQVLLLALKITIRHHYHSLNMPCCCDSDDHKT